MIETTAIILGVLLISVVLGANAIDTEAISETFETDPIAATTGTGAFMFAWNGLIPASSFFDGKLVIASPDITDIIGIAIFFIIGLIVIKLYTFHPSPARNTIYSFLFMIGMIALGWFFWKLAFLPWLLKWGAIQLSLDPVEVMASLKEAQLELFYIKG